MSQGLYASPEYYGDGSDVKAEYLLASQEPIFNHGFDARLNLKVTNGVPSIHRKLHMLDDNQLLPAPCVAVLNGYRGIECPERTEAIEVHQLPTLLQHAQISPDHLASLVFADYASFVGSGTAAAFAQAFLQFQSRGDHILVQHATDAADETFKIVLKQLQNHCFTAVRDANTIHVAQSCDTELDTALLTAAFRKRAVRSTLEFRGVENCVRHGGLPTYADGVYDAWPGSTVDTYTEAVEKFNTLAWQWQAEKGEDQAGMMSFLQARGALQPAERLESSFYGLY